jgi:hypothetical protein
MCAALEWEPRMSTSLLTWDESERYAESLGEGWRLPTVHELMTRVDYTRRNPAAKGDIPGFSERATTITWTGTQVAQHVSLSWILDFEEGQVFPASKCVRARVLCVRG